VQQWNSLNPYGLEDEENAICAVWELAESPQNFRSKITDFCKMEDHNTSLLLKVYIYQE
jgi:hypothetical protein